MQKPSWVKNPEDFTSDKSSVCFAFEDPDGKIGAELRRSHKFLYLNGDRCPLRSWLKAKELRQVDTKHGKQKQRKKHTPATGANATELSTGNMEQSTTDPTSTTFPLPPKPQNAFEMLARKSKKPPRSAVEVEADRLEKALERIEARVNNESATSKFTSAPQTEDA